MRLNTFEIRKYFFVGLIFLLCKCEYIEPELYNYPQALNFKDYVENGFDYVSKHNPNFIFNDEDYKNRVLNKLDSIRVEVIGYTLQEDRTFCIKTEGIEGDKISPMIIKLENNGVYKIKAGEFEKWIHYRVVMPIDFNVEHKAIISIDTANTQHQFKTGKIEAMKMIASVTYDLSTGKWDNRFLGKYSSGKYKFIIDLTKQTLNTLKLEYRHKQYFRDEYEKYLKKGLPIILDDEGEPIQFPL